MNRPSTSDYIGMIAIGAVFCLLALGAAFGGAGTDAIIALVVLIGPVSLYGNRLIKTPSRGQRHTEAPQQELRPQGAAWRLDRVANTPSDDLDGRCSSNATWA